VHRMGRAILGWSMGLATAAWVVMPTVSRWVRFSEVQLTRRQDWVDGLPHDVRRVAVGADRRPARHTIAISLWVGTVLARYTRKRLRRLWNTGSVIASAMRSAPALTAQRLCAVMRNEGIHAHGSTPSQGCDAPTAG